MHVYRQKLAFEADISLANAALLIWPFLSNVNDRFIEFRTLYLSFQSHERLSFRPGGLFRHKIIGLIRAGAFISRNPRYAVANLCEGKFSCVWQ